MIGIPVYLHYCGGELEDVSYVIKKISCCGSEEEEDDSMAMNGCCQDQNLVLRLSTDFSFKKVNDNIFVKAITDLFFVSLPFNKIDLPIYSTAVNIKKEFPPPKLQNDLLISTSVLII